MNLNLAGGFDGGVCEFPSASVPYTQKPQAPSTTSMDRITQEVNIPAELANFPEALILWPKLLRRSTPHHLRRFGIPDLAFRLTCQGEREGRNGGELDVQARAVIWHGVAARCAEGKSEVHTPTEQELRRWMPGKEKECSTVRINCAGCGTSMRVLRNSKFSSCRKCRGQRRRSEAVARGFNRTGELVEGWKFCHRCNGPFESRKKNSRYCSQRCQKRAYRDAGQNQRSISPGVREQGALGVVNA